MIDYNKLFRHVATYSGKKKRFTRNDMQMWIMWILQGKHKLKISLKKKKIKSNQIKLIWHSLNSQKTMLKYPTPDCTDPIEPPGENFNLIFFECYVIITLVIDNCYY